jgi:predicted DCC family thiol-disulfide oxidoreductase YuxK
MLGFAMLTPTYRTREAILLVYDKQCPVCDNYCQLVHIRETVGDLKLVDARESSAVMDEITAQGLDIDQGMVLKMGDRLYYGSDAIHALALISSRSGIFNRLNYWMFKSRTLSYLFYPILRFFRNLLLKLLRRTKINNLGLENNDRF